MVPFEALSAKRAARARLLATRYPAAREALTFYAEIASFQGRMDPKRPLAAWSALVDLVIESGPGVLKSAARDLDEDACRKALDDYLRRLDVTSPRSFFARVLLQPHMSTLRSSGDPNARGSCPRCGHPPQVGCLRAVEYGRALSLICTLCLAEFPFPRGHCPACGQTEERNTAYYSAAELEHVQVQACESCRAYFHSVSLAKDPEAVPDVDEVSALPLDVWAQAKGYRKVHPNLAGI